MQDIFLTVYIPVIVWIGLVVIFLIALIIKFTFGRWTQDNPNPYEKETFALPRGIMRGILTLSLLFVFVLLEVVNILNGKLEEYSAGLLTAFQMMLAFYFGGKAVHHIVSVEKQKANKKAETEISVNKAKYSSREEDLNTEPVGL